MAATTRLNPLKLGLTLALTMGIMYTVCAFAWVAWQEPALDFLNAVFHGLDFRKLQIAGSRFSFKAFVYPLFVMSAWGFVTGALFGAIANRLQGRLTPGNTKF